MRRKIIMIIAVVICILIFGICFFKSGKTKLKYDNEQDFQDLITYRYSSGEFSDIQEALKSGKDISLFKIADPKKMECLRNVEGIKYALLLSEKNEKLFIFFDDNNIVTDAFYIENDFLEQKDFINVQEGVTLMSDIEILDGSAVYYDLSAVWVTGHIVKEGLIIIEYDRLLDGKLLNDPVVKSIDFYSNDEILEIMASNYYVLTTPYILPKDKQ